MISLDTEMATSRPETLSTVDYATRIHIDGATTIQVVDSLGETGVAGTRTTAILDNNSEKSDDEEDSSGSSSGGTPDEELCALSVDNYGKYAEVCNYAMRLYDRQWKRQLRHRKVRESYKKLRRRLFALYMENNNLKKKYNRLTVR